MIKTKNVRNLVVAVAIMAVLFTLGYLTKNSVTQDADRDLATLPKTDHNLENPHSSSSVVKNNQDLSTMADFKVASLDFLSDDIPANFLAKEVKGDEKRINIMGFDTFYRESPPSKIKTSLTVVLLHGMFFKSETWVELGTFSLLSEIGHRVVAFDLPGYGNSPGEKVPEDQRGDFLNQAFDSLHIVKPVIVSPSMSGSFSLPFLFQFKGKMGGYIPVAPIFTEKYSAAEYKSVNTPTLIVYGELDEQLGELSTNNLRQLSNNQIIMLPKAKHPAYLDQPEMFHKLLYYFLLNVPKIELLY